MNKRNQKYFKKLGLQKKTFKKKMKTKGRIKVTDITI